MLIIVIVLTVVASHTHCHFKPPFMEQGKTIVSPARNLTWKELLAYGTSVRLTVRSQPARSEKTGQLYFLDWTLPPVLANRLHISNHLPTNPLHPQNTSLIQTVTHTCCHFATKVKERPFSPLKRPPSTPWAPPNSRYCHASSSTVHSKTNWIMAVLALTPFYI